MAFDRLEPKIKEVLLEAIKRQLFPGCAIGVILPDNQQLIITGGHYTYELNSLEIKPDSIFDLASVTKSIPTACLALKLIEESRLSPGDQLIKFIPKFNNFDREKILIKHLLTQTVSYSFQLSKLKDCSPDEIIQTILTSEFNDPPGEKFYYANASSILLGLVVERIYQKPLDQIADEIFFRPLGMNRTTFRPLERFSQEAIVPTEEDNWRGRLIQGEVHDESAYTLRKSMIVGSAGLFSTVPDLLRFLAMILNQGELDGKRYFQPETIELMQTNQLANLNLSASYGWELNQTRFMGHRVSAKTFGKTGFTGCSCLIDLDKQISIIILSNYIYPKRKPDYQPLNQFRCQISDIVFQLLGSERN